MTRRRGSGFSLLELLVTLFLIVLLTSLVTFNLSSGGREVVLEALVRDLTETAVYALDEAQMTGSDYGLLMRRFQHEGDTVYGYDWRERQEAVWQEPVTGKEIFSRRLFPPEIELRLELEEVPVAELPLLGEPGSGQPQIVLFASGEVTPGALDVRKRNGPLLWRAEWDGLGRFRLLRRDAQGNLENADERDDS